MICSQRSAWVRSLAYKFWTYWSWKSLTELHCNNRGGDRGTEESLLQNQWVTAKIERCKKAAVVTDMMSVASRTTPRLQTSGFMSMRRFLVCWSRTLGLTTKSCVLFLLSLSRLDDIRVLISCRQLQVIVGGAEWRVRYWDKEVYHQHRNVSTNYGGRWSDQGRKTRIRSGVIHSPESLLFYLLSYQSYSKLSRWVILTLWSTSRHKMPSNSIA